MEGRSAPGAREASAAAKSLPERRTGDGPDTWDCPAVQVHRYWRCGPARGRSGWCRHHERLAKDIGRQRRERWASAIPSAAALSNQALPSSRLAPIVTRRAGILAGEVGRAAARERRPRALASRAGRPKPRAGRGRRGAPALSPALCLPTPQPPLAQYRCAIVARMAGPPRQWIAAMLDQRL